MPRCEFLDTKDQCLLAITFAQIGEKHDHFPDGAYMVTLPPTNHIMIAYYCRLAKFNLAQSACNKYFEQIVNE